MCASSLISVYVGLIINAKDVLKKKAGETGKAGAGGTGSISAEGASGVAAEAFEAPTMKGT